MDGEITAIIAISMIFGAPMLTVIIVKAIKALENAHRTSMETRLKMQMVDRGYSIAEIERLCHLTIDAGRMKVAKFVGPEKPVRV